MTEITRRLGIHPAHGGPMRQMPPEMSMGSLWRLLLTPVWESNLPPDPNVPNALGAYLGAS